MPVATSRKSTTKFQRISDTDRLAEYNAYIDLCFKQFELDGDDFKEVSNRTGLCYSTIHRIATVGVTLATHIGTMDAISRAAGFRLDMSGDHAKMYIARRPKRR